MYACPEHFIVRPGPTGRGEVFVPLIAVDQLPDWMQLAGVPREFDAEEAVGLINLGTVACDGSSTYEVRLHTGKIREILSTSDEGGEECSLEPSDSVSSNGKVVEGEDQTQATSVTSPKQLEEARAEEKKPKIPEETKVQVDLLGEISEEAAGIGEPSEVVSTPPVRTTRAWADDESDIASPDIVPANAWQPSVTIEEETKQASKEAEKPAGPAPEPGLSASRHNPANDLTQSKPPRNDKDIRPHLTAEIRDARARRPIAPRMTKDKLFGTNPDTVYCRHWCHHGTCKWGWECRYQHRMPSDPDGLREVGLRDFPTWYLLMMAGQGFPESPGIGGGLGSGLPVNYNMGFHGGMDMSMNMNAMNLAMPNHSHYLNGLHRPPHPTDALLNGSRRAQHSQPTPSPLELRLMQGRMSALLASSTAMSNRQKLRQIKEMRELFLRSNALAQPGTNALSPLPEHGGYASIIGMGSYGLHQGRANLHTNASLAANAAGLSAASRRQALREAERGANAPVEIPAGEDAVESGKGAAHDELEGRLTPVGSEGGGDGAEEDTAVREGQLVDIS